MAISFVGAGVIWRFVYDLNPPGTPLQPGEQIGVLNAIVTEARSDQDLNDAIGAFAARGVPIDEAAVADTIIQAESEALEEAVAEETLTRERADRLLELLPDRARGYLNGEIPAIREPWQTVGLWSRLAVGAINDRLATLGDQRSEVICAVAPYECEDAIVDAEEDALDAAVEAERITADEADALIDTLPEAAAAFVAQGTLPTAGYLVTDQWAALTAEVDTVSVRGLNLALDTGAQPIDWIREPAINNIALIIVGVWIWTGFCTVVLSASLKNIPAELFEAARVDGANEFQIFFRITIPQLMPTLTVVTTTMLITVLKVFDIVYVMTAGNFGTEVIANRMYFEMYGGNREFGHASAIAVILMLAIVPVMIFNIVQFRKQEASR
ncbi:MAG: sugar ABC transporter permease [Chloroflexi bacterium]|nr:sugar ABC transporter permease [Chloroflexota bacterium]